MWQQSRIDSLRSRFGGDHGTSCCDRGMSLDTRRAKVAAYAQRYNRELSEVIVDAADADWPCWW